MRIAGTRLRKGNAIGKLIIAFKIRYLKVCFIEAGATRRRREPRRV